MKDGWNVFRYRNEDSKSRTDSPRNRSNALGHMGSRAISQSRCIAGSHSALRGRECNKCRSDPPLSHSIPSYPQKLTFGFGPSNGSMHMRTVLPKKRTCLSLFFAFPRSPLKYRSSTTQIDLTLNRGVGRILGTAQIGRPGNLGIAGHRDGFFRGLKDIGPGDYIEILRPGGTDRYAVSQVQIVTPADTYVLNSVPKPTLTLVTCFPFYYVGSAPKRYVVTAAVENSSQKNQTASRVSIATGNNTNNKEKKK